MRPAPARQVRATYCDETILVYQAYAPAIADAALSAGTFVPPFSRDRMTWVKPSFLWRMYRLPLLPEAAPYPLPPGIAARLGTTT